MSMVICNPTDEQLTGCYVGEETKLEPDSKIKVDDARGRHLLNKLGPRGLFQLHYGDEGKIEKQKAKDALARNRTFRMKQVAEYNRSNELRKQQHMEYLEPPEQIKTYAKSLKIELVQPYLPSDTRTPEIEDLKKEGKAKDKKIDDLQAQMSALMGEMTKLTAAIAGGNVLAPRETLVSKAEKKK